MEGILKQSSCLKCPHLIYKVVLESGYLNVSATVTWQDQRPSLKASFSPSPLERMQQTGISHFIPLRPLYSQYTRFCMWVAKPALRHHHYLSIGETNLPPMSKPCHVGVSYTEQKKQFCWECKKYTKLCFFLNLQFWSHYTVCMTLLPLFISIPKFPLQAQSTAHVGMPYNSSCHGWIEQLQNCSYRVKRKYFGFVSN